MQTRFDTRETADFWIRFADTPDLAPAKDIADWGERGQFVYDALTSTAKASQAGVVADLKAAGADYESYWISNAILVEDGTAKLAKQVAASREVKQVHERFAAQPIEPVERKAPTKNAPLATEWGLDAIGAPDVWEMGSPATGSPWPTSTPASTSSTRPCCSTTAATWAKRGSSNDYNWFDASGSCDGAPCDIDAHGTHVMGTMVGDDQDPHLLGTDREALPIALDDVRHAHETGDELVRRVLVDLGGRADLLDAPVREDGQAVAHRKRLLLVVGNVNEGDADLALDRAQLVLHLLAQLEVECSERLVQQQHAGADSRALGRVPRAGAGRRRAGRDGDPHSRTGAPCPAPRWRGGGARPYRPWRSAVRIPRSRPRSCGETGRSPERRC